MISINWTQSVEMMICSKGGKVSEFDRARRKTKTAMRLGLSLSTEFPSNHLATISNIRETFVEEHPVDVLRYGQRVRGDL